MQANKAAAATDDAEQHDRVARGKGHRQGDVPSDANHLIAGGAVGGDGLPMHRFIEVIEVHSTAAWSLSRFYPGSGGERFGHARDSTVASPSREGGGLRWRGAPSRGLRVQARRSR